MAEMVLFPHELERGGLPDKCVVCGAEPCTPVKRQFRVSVGASDYAVVKVHQLRVREGWVPLCGRHQNHFLSPVFALLAGCGTFAAGLVLMGLIGFWSSVRGFFALGFFVAGVVGAVLIARHIKNSAVQETDVTDEGVRLKNLSEEFVKAVTLARESAGKQR